MFLCKYYIVISDTLVDSLLNVLFLLLAVILSQPHEKTGRNKDLVTEKSTQKNLSEGQDFFDCTPSFYVTLCCFHRLLPSPSQVTYLMNGRKYENLKFLVILYQLVSIYKNMIYFRLCYGFSCPGYDLTLIKKSHTLNFYSFLQKFFLKTKTCKLVVGNCCSSNNNC